MATRAEIKDAFMTEIETATGTYDVTDENGNVVDTVTLDASNILLRHPRPSEEYPQVVYHEDYTRVTYNGVGRAPHAYEYNNDGSVAAALYHGFEEAQFLVDVRVGGDNAEMRKEPIFEDIRRAFGKYDNGAWPASDFHGDAKNVYVVSSSTADSGDVEDVIRGDQIDVRVVYKRVYRDEQKNIDTVESKVDSDNDGTVDDTYTTN